MNLLNEISSSRNNNANLDQRFSRIYKNMNNHTKKAQDQVLLDKIHQELDKTKKFPKTCLNFYKIIKLIGKGSFGKVYLATQKLTNRLVAIKALEK